MDEKLTPEELAAREERRAYHREYRHRNRKKILERERKWRLDNPEKIKEYNRNYWLRKTPEAQSNK